MGLEECSSKALQAQVKWGNCKYEGIKRNTRIRILG
jgi:hypothetical protein